MEPMSEDALCRLLEVSGLASGPALIEARRVHKERGGSLTDTLFSMNVVDPDRFLNLMLAQREADQFHGDSTRLSQKLIDALPATLVRKHEVIAIDHTPQGLIVAAANSLTPQVLGAIEHAAGQSVNVVLCPSGDVHAAIARYYPMASDMPPLGGRERLSETATLIRSLETLPALPETLTAFREAMADPETPLPRIVEILTLDPPAAASLLRVANSAAYGFSHKISDLTHAVSLLGLRETYGVVLSSAVVDLVKKFRHFDYRAYWLESVCCATACRIVVHAAGRARMQGVFSAGLLHDIGRAALWETVPKKYEQIDPALKGTALVQAEERYAGLSHPEAGHQLALLWQLPPEIATPIRFHHRPAEADQAQEQVAVVALASAMVAASGMPEERRREAFDGYECCFETLGLDSEIVEAMLDRYLRNFETAIKEASG